jgi:hypothetical protein
VNSFDQNELKDQVVYEVFFLQELFKVIDKPLSGVYREVWVYEPSASSPKFGIKDRASMPGHWREGFLRIGGPLVLISAFKILDLIVEWILEPPSKGGMRKFQEKMNLLKDPALHIPEFFRAQPWVWERLVALYEGLFRLRNTIVHAAKFETTLGGIQVAPSEGKGAYGTAVSLSADALRAIASIVVLLAKILGGSWEPNLYADRQLRWLLDQLQSVHGQPLDGGKAPIVALVRIYRDAATFIQFDVAKISSDINQPMPGRILGHDAVVDFRMNHALFDLELIVREMGGQVAAYRIPFTSIDEFQVGIRDEQLWQFTIDLPQDLSA